ncbi:MAG: 1-acyl-sn-glycerol-3-phosphate acyltransferase [Clostridia bacterium]|nr:1-acyl-sn-glycerol-3-phosphate acyltransferase [Clostridia bacterium]
MDKKMKEIRYYSSFSDDFSQTRDQNYKLPEGYLWINNSIGFKLLSGLIYGAAILFSNIYCRLFLKVSIKNRKVLKKAKKTGGFIYCNHTMPVGDVFNPALACLPGRIYTIVSPANYAIPVIGKLLPYLGALPVSDTLSGIKKLNEAIKTRLSEKKYIVIYPEAHVWEYYTDIRPFADTSFKYPVKFDKPSFCITTTYQKSLIGKKPKATLYVDGPFFPDKDKSQKEQTEQLKSEIAEVMKERSRNSSYCYIKYLHKQKFPQ